MYELKNIRQTRKELIKLKTECEATLEMIEEILGDFRCAYDCNEALDKNVRFKVGQLEEIIKSIKYYEIKKSELPKIYPQ